MIQGIDLSPAMAVAIEKKQSSTSEKPHLFEIRAQEISDSDYRLGTLSCHGRIAIDTPHYVALTSRGAVPHLTQDMLRDNTAIKGMYAALEDYIEKAPKQVPPVYRTPKSQNESPLRGFIAIERDALLILGPRRVPPLPSPVPNTYTGISVLTAVGFGMLESEDYAEAVEKLQPDIAIGLGDIVFGQKSGAKRLEIMGDRTLAWTEDMVSELTDRDSKTSKVAFFAPILPIELGQQNHYLDALKDELSESVSGLVMYDVGSIEAIPKELHHLPRLSLTELNSPHQLLDEISLGIDIFTVPFVGAATDAGIALDFYFPAEQENVLRPLGIDMWSNVYATDLAPLRQDCGCYACKNHHRAYLQHLLSAKEMLGWVLLQLHNHHIIDEFFSGVRHCIHSGSFDSERIRFRKSYEETLPAKTGRGPRVRGYQFKTEGKGGPKKNPQPFRSLDDGKERLRNTLLPSPNADADDLEQRGFAEKLA